MGRFVREPAYLQELLLAYEAATSNSACRPVATETAARRQRFIHEVGKKWKCRRDTPAGITLEVEMSTTHLALALKILAILELIIKALVIYLTR